MNKKLIIILALVLVKIFYDIFCFTTNIHELQKFIANMIFNFLIIVILFLNKSKEEKSNIKNLKIYFVISQIVLVALFVCKTISIFTYLVFSIVIVFLFFLFLKKKTETK